MSTLDIQRLQKYKKNATQTIARVGSKPRRGVTHAVQLTPHTVWWWRTRVGLHIGDMRQLQTHYVSIIRLSVDNNAGVIEFYYYRLHPRPYDAAVVA